MSELGPPVQGVLADVQSPMLPLTAGEQSITQGNLEPSAGPLTESEDGEDYEHSSMIPPPPERNRDLVMGNGPTPTTQGNIGDSIGGEVNPPNGL